MGIENFIAFLVATILFVLTPGIETVFLINKSISQGRRSGVYTSFGLNTGALVHTLFGALGLSIMVAKSAIFFALIKYLGAAYLIYLGVTKVMSKKGLIANTNEEQKKNSAKSSFTSGFVTNILNPKVALFFIAFFPQFISPTEIENPVPFIIMGVIYAVMTTIWYLVLTSFAGIFSTKIKENEKIGVRLNKISGVIFVLMGLQIAFM
ncbi:MULTISPECIES: LysE family translocator [Tenacibaculum]|uniref:LysE family translocator n=1 Tax=Tenacibaculum sp. Pbs-1 TaxID=3238748 RepID=A0AB33L5D3_9FLAO|nr:MULTISPECIES: LysE family translocator [Tenacibaculum]MCO7186212.1 LysE family translocator [Tenacibaculum sp. XPcli2-G]BFF36793.1 LysE family translocator [Tenacibaculum mesophilum]BFF40126.1 LysE family translocator [Tenacibaculum mesophilum]GFD81070.1 lysine transporter LysE [Tenacibaculum sp. KUL118]